MEEYKAIIGLEMHCEMSYTNTKVFSPAENTYTNIPNSTINPIDMAFPGTLPVLNKEAVKLALKASMILNCQQPEYMYFERKNYYYPDLPKGYQITQETKPAPVGIYGSLTFNYKGTPKTIRINNIHLEEDSASSTHYSDCSTLNYNRAGVPLLELVTEPDFHSADEAVAFLETMRSIYQYAEISEADNKKGQIRCDVNVSIMEKDKDETNKENWGTKVEIKNVSSFSGVRETINYEIERQIELKKNGTYDKMEQQTRRWDEDTMTTVYMRGKVDAIDYKYFVEPNIPKFKISEEWLQEIRSSIPELAYQRKEKYINKYGLPEHDANILIKEKNISDFYEETIKRKADPKKASNWITSTILGYLNKNELEIKDLFLTPQMLVEIIELVDNKTISSKQGKEILYHVIEEQKEPKQLIEQLGMTQIGNNDEIKQIVKEVFAENPEAKDQYKAGKTNIIDYLVGQVMKKTKGRANPAITMEQIKEEMER